MRPRSLLLLSCAAAALLLLYLGFRLHSPKRPPDAQARFAAWQSAHSGEVAAYLDYLRTQRVAEVLPPGQLLRRGRRWQTCGGVEFGLPPRAAWPQMVPTLRLLADLRARQLLLGARAASGYRDPAYNRCEGGSAASRHLSNQAIDLDLPSANPEQVEALCEAWRRLGPSRKWGLGFYSPTRVHLDTAGFRTWGYDFHRGSSLCR